MSRPLPMIFDTSNILFEDRMSAYKNILGLCKPDEVSDKIAKYVAQNVNSSGWQAVWRSTPKSSGHNQPFDVLVEVMRCFCLFSSNFVPKKEHFVSVLMNSDLIFVLHSHIWGNFPV